MKKILVLLLTVAMIATMFIGCAKKTGFGSTSADTNGNGLRDDVELKIMEATHNEMLSPKDFDHKDIKVKYYGTYNGAVVVNVRHRKLYYAAAIFYETVANFEFTYSDSGAIITVWYNGEFYRMKDLFELGVLNEEEIGEIHAKHRN